MQYSNYQDKPWPFAITYLFDLLRFRHLCWNLVGSDLRSRFRRSRLGMLWAIIQPLGFSLMLALVWGTLFQNKTFWEFTIYTFAGMVVWEFFVNSVFGGLDALVGASGYLKQSRIPFLIFQARVPLTSAIMFLFALAGLIGLMTVLQLTGAQKFPAGGLHYLLVPLFIPMMLMFTLPVAVLFSFLGAQFRDTRHIMQLAVQGLFFISPVMLAREILEKPQLAWMKIANPIVPLLDLFRAPLLEGRFWDRTELITYGVWVGALWMFALLVSGRFGRKIVFAL